MGPDDFDYELPERAIGQTPVEPRDAARLLVDLGDRVEHRRVRDLPELLRDGDLVVVNDTRVLPARVLFTKPTGGRVEVLLLEPRDDGTWECLVKPGRRVPAGMVVTAPGGLSAEVGDSLGAGRRAVRFDTGELDLVAALEAHGQMPLPPYLHTELDDPDRYQTVYADRPASAAAPTAGLHFTSETLEGLTANGIGLARVELVVGLDTFRPIAVDDLDGHQMHSESYEVPKSTWEAVQSAERVVAVGTTTVRALESAAATGRLVGRTDLFIRHPYRFEVVDALLTNFHLPRSTLLVMIDAFIGPRWRELYALALEADYRFLSFGDAMLLERRIRGRA